MDALTHAVVGGATGYALGGNWFFAAVGATVALLPDAPIWVGKRRAEPPLAYTALHSGIAAVMVVAVGLYKWLYQDYLLELFLTIALAWVSHIVLDLPTHCAKWQPKLLYPFSNRILFPKAKEWEWFDDTWFLGAYIAFYWVMICLGLSR